MDAIQETEPLEFDIMDKAIGPRRQGESFMKDEEAFGAIVAHLNRLEGVDLQPDLTLKKIFLNSPLRMRHEAVCLWTSLLPNLNP